VRESGLKCVAETYLKPELASTAGVQQTAHAGVTAGTGDHQTARKKAVSSYELKQLIYPLRGFSLKQDAFFLATHAASPTTSTTLNP
jgi:hypothetical protein